MTTRAVLAVGRLRACFRDACDLYTARLARQGPWVVQEVREAGKAGSPLVQRREEARRLRARIPDQAVRVAVTRGGSAWSSRALADRVAAWEAGSRPVVVLLGGGTGLDADLMEEADLRWSLGPLTLPHELARVVVVEQLYRAGTILRGEPYHKGA